MSLQGGFRRFPSTSSRPMSMSTSLSARGLRSTDRAVSAKFHPPCAAVRSNTAASCISSTKRRGLGSPSIDRIFLRRYRLGLSISCSVGMPPSPTAQRSDSGRCFLVYPLPSGPVEHWSSVSASVSRETPIASYPGFLSSAYSGIPSLHPSRQENSSLAYRGESYHGGDVELAVGASCCRRNSSRSWNSARS